MSWFGLAWDEDKKKAEQNAIQAERKASQEEQLRRNTEKERDEERDKRAQSEQLAQQKDAEKAAAERKAWEETQERLAAERAQNEERAKRAAADQRAETSENRKEEAEKKAWEELQKRVVAEEEKEQERRKREESEKTAAQSQLEREKAEKKALEEAHKRKIAEKEKDNERRSKEESQKQAEIEKRQADEQQEILQEQLKSLSAKPDAFRNVDLEEPLLADRKQKIMTTKPCTKKVPYMNVLILGLVGHGKTSFVNTVYSTLAGNVVALCPVGTSEKSLTKLFRMHRLGMKDGKELAFFRLCDTMGVEGNDGITEQDLSAIMDGHIKDKYTFNPAQAINAKHPNYLKNPTLKDKMHCVCICVSAAKLSVLIPGNSSQTSQADGGVSPMQKLRRIKNEVNSKGLSFIIILTNIDGICPMVKLDPSKTFHSERVEAAVRETATLFGVPANQVFPVRNYEEETECIPAISSMALYACQKMIDYANAYLENAMR